MGQKRLKIGFRSPNNGYVIRIRGGGRQHYAHRNVIYVDWHEWGKKECG